MQGQKEMISMICSVNTEKAVPEIVAVLHKYQIPIALVSQVFDKVMHDINANTVPYNPNLDNINDLAISDTTDSVTEPKG